jgi:predicted RNA-binding Zn ribbon-like protein
MTQNPSPSNPQSEEYQFDLDGDILCLDFVNTLAGRSGEHLHAYADLLAFAAQSRLITPSEANRLHAGAVDDITGAEEVLGRAKRLRDGLRGIFASLANGRAPLPRDLAVLNRELSIGLRYAQVMPSQDAATGFAWSWNMAATRLDALLWPISRSAADLLTSAEQLPLVRECGADDCRWLFLDTSKNRTRQWCSMTSCGNREKARRHYERVRTLRRGSAVNK